MQQHSTKASPLLLIEAERERRTALVTRLQEDDWKVVTAETPAEAATLLHQPLALMVLALHLPTRETIREVQTLCAFAHEHDLPLLFLLEPGMEVTQVERAGLRADDYLASPLQVEEVLACVRTLLCRGWPSAKRPRSHILPRVRRNPFREAGQVLVVGNLRIDVAGRQVFQQGRELPIGSPVMFDLLVYLARHHGQVLAPQRLLEQVWGYTQKPLPVTGLRTVYVHICQLRSLIETAPTEHGCSIQTIRGKGYQFLCQGQEAD